MAIQLYTSLSLPDPDPTFDIEDIHLKIYKGSIYSFELKGSVTIYTG